MSFEYIGYKSAKVLLIDDEANFRKSMSKLLKDWDMRVSTFSNSREAMDDIEDESPDIIILGVRLPDINGFDLCKRLRDNVHTRNIPVIIMSILRSERDKIRGLESGADDYITKPFHSNELIARMRAVMRSYH